MAACACASTKRRETSSFHIALADRDFGNLAPALELRVRVDTGLARSNLLTFTAGNPRRAGVYIGFPEVSRHLALVGSIGERFVSRTDAGDGAFRYVKARGLHRDFKANAGFQYVFRSGPPERLRSAVLRCACV